MKKQIVLIHGGSTYDTYDEYLENLKETVIDIERNKKKRWSHTLEEDLGGGFEVLALQMPNKENAKYLEWKIWFEKYIPFFNDDAIIIGKSLGGIFLAKYFSENDYPKKIKAMFLLAPPHDSTNREYSLADFILPNSLEKLEVFGSSLHLYHSKDDPVVDIDELSKYEAVLPEAQIRVFENYGHLGQAEFPELIEDIRNLV